MTTRPTPFADALVDVGAAIFVVLFCFCVCLLLVVWTVVLVEGFAALVAHAVGAVT